MASSTASGGPGPRRRRPRRPGPGARPRRVRRPCARRPRDRRQLVGARGVRCSAWCSAPGCGRRDGAAAGRRPRPAGPEVASRSSSVRSARDAPARTAGSSPPVGHQPGHARAPTSARRQGGQRPLPAPPRSARTSSRSTRSSSSTWPHRPPPVGPLAAPLRERVLPPYPGGRAPAVAPRPGPPRRRRGGAPAGSPACRRRYRTGTPSGSPTSSRAIARLAGGQSAGGHGAGTYTPANRRYRLPASTTPEVQLLCNSSQPVPPRAASRRRGSPAAATVPAWRWQRSAAYVGARSSPTSPA